jgi:hypothetical protein
VSGIFLFVGALVCIALIYVAALGIAKFMSLYV